MIVYPRTHPFALEPQKNRHTLHRSTTLKIDRLIGIITILLQNEKVTAPALAARFEVSRRTINRDIEDICKAGIPIVTTQGANGGIAIMDSYKIDKALFSIHDLTAIFTGLATLESVTKDNKYQHIIEKFALTKDSLMLKSSILIDLSSHYKSTLSPKIGQLQASIETGTKVRFTYHGQYGSHTATIDPYLIVFQWSSWYLLGFDDSAGQFKLYKLNRMCNLAATDLYYDLQEIPPEKLDFDNYFSDDIHAVILFDVSQKYRLIDEYGADSFTELPEGQLRFSFAFTNESYLLSWVLGFGETAELLEPAELRPVLKSRLRQMLGKYSE